MGPGNASDVFLLYVAEVQQGLADLLPRMGELWSNEWLPSILPDIVSREYRMPCVVDTVVGTSVMRDGMQLTVDGSKGIVRIDSRI